MASQALSHKNVKVLAKLLGRHVPYQPWIPVLAFHRRYTVRLADYARRHPLMFTTQVLGGTLLTASVLLMPVLGAIGFSAVGPVAGSAAAAWQASIGPVAAGSLFAWCQSVTMGGMAATTVVTTSALGGVAAVAPGIGRVGCRMANIGNRIKDKWATLWM